jgi:peptidyl-prolyl cis-trans isomerase D
MRVLPLLFTLAACGAHQAGGMTGPSMNNRVEVEPPPPEIQSNDILARDMVTRHAVVKHILIGWKERGPAYGGHQDPRGAARSRADADTLAAQILGRVRAGEAIEPLMVELSEDQGSAQSGESYDVTPDAGLVFEFRRLSLRLNVGETGLVMTDFGWHIIQRIE